MTTKENAGQTRTQSSKTPFKEEEANQQCANQFLYKVYSNPTRRFFYENSADKIIEPE